MSAVPGRHVDAAADDPVAPYGARPEASPLLTCKDISKAFGATKALRSCSFELSAGEIHAIVGENGSGKSTLVKILSGVHAPDTGQLTFGGNSLQLRGPRQAQASGIFTVFQEVMAIATRSVVENVWLGADGVFTTKVPKAEKREAATRALTELLGECPPPGTPVGALSLSARQACCIARALVRSPRVLILDESTSALDIATRDRLFEILRRLRAEGTSTIFISHRMDEIQILADRVTVLRSGESVATLGRAESSTDVLVRHMTGGSVPSRTPRSSGSQPRAGGDLVLRAEGVRLTDNGAAIDFELRAGELVGLAGLEGHGQDHFLHTLRGVGTHGGRVVSISNGAQTVLGSARSAFSEGIMYIPRDRRSESLFPALTIQENFGVATLRQDQRLGLLNWSSTRKRLQEYGQRLHLRMAAPTAPITALSGGNQQKVIIARWLAAKPRVLLLNDPTRGVDINAKNDLYGLLDELTATGVAVVMLSTEVDEHIALMDKVLVFREHSVAATLEQQELTRDTLISAFFGRGSTSSDA
jgi:ABC-type sugar transport system ATPase subunit